MKKKIVRAPSPAMVVACLALTVALTGASYAAVVLPRNSVGTAQLKPNAVTSAKVKSDALTGADVKEATLGQVPSALNAQSAANATNAQNAANAQNATNAQSAANADRLDNLDSTAFAQAGHSHDDRYFTESEADARYVKTTDERVFAYGQIREDGSIRNGSSRLASVAHPSTGIYCLTFSAAPLQVRAEAAVVGSAGTSHTVMFPRVTNGQGADCSTVPGSHLFVRIHNASGALVDGRFSFIVP